MQLSDKESDFGVWRITFICGQACLGICYLELSLSHSLLVGLTYTKNCSHLSYFISFYVIYLYVVSTWQVFFSLEALSV